MLETLHELEEWDWPVIMVVEQKYWWKRGGKGHSGQQSINRRAKMKILIMWSKQPKQEIGDTTFWISWIYRSRIIAGAMGMLYDVYITYIHRFLAPELLTIYWLRCYAQYIVGSRRTCYHLLVQAFMGTNKFWGSDIICM